MPSKDHASNDTPATGPGTRPATGPATGPTTGPTTGPAIGGPVAWAVRQLLLANREAEHALARRLRLGANDVTALEHLMTTPEGLGPADLAQRLGIRSASATVLVDRLEEAGHVVRAAHVTDRRRTVVVPTPHARAEIMAALSPLIGSVDSAAAQFDAGEQAVIVRFLEQAAAGLLAAAQELASEP